MCAFPRPCPCPSGDGKQRPRPRPRPAAATATSSRGPTAFERTARCADVPLVTLFRGTAWRFCVTSGRKSVSGGDLGEGVDSLARHRPVFTELRITRECLAHPLHPLVACVIVPFPLRKAEVCSLQVDGARDSHAGWRSSTVEQLICNQQVAGSNPIASSTDPKSTGRRAGVAEWSKAADCKSAGVMPTVVQIHPPAPTCVLFNRAGGSNSVVESQPSKLLVAGSSPVSRSRREGDFRPT